MVEINLFKKCCLYVFALLAFYGQAQSVIEDNFSDGDFTSSPSWQGTTTHFVVNGNHQLQLSNTVASTSYLVTPLTVNVLGAGQWEFQIRNNFAGSSTNYSRVYLLSDQENLSGNLNGYFLQFGEAQANDAIELFRQTGNTTQSVCRGANGFISSAFDVRMKVVRNSEGQWQVYAGPATNTTMTLQASGVDNVHTLGSYFGLRCTYTASNAQNVFFDNVNIHIPDDIPPSIVGFAVVSANELDIQFDEALEAESASTVTNYSIAEGSIHPEVVQYDNSTQTVRLSFENDFINAHEENLLISDVYDINGNSVGTLDTSFFYYIVVPPSANDIVISELFPDPSPPVGLPESEFVELFNRSEYAFNLTGWKITDGQSTGTLGDHTLLPGQYVIVTYTGNVAAFNSYGSVIGVNPFPSLNNSSDLIFLLDNTSKKIDSVYYDLTTYKDSDKDGGGYTLEIINPSDSCRTTDNWTASRSDTGGTPGVQNSVYEINSDIIPPVLKVSPGLFANEILVESNERLHWNTLEAASFAINNDLIIESLTLDSSLSIATLHLSEDLDSTTTYTLTVSNVKDCPGNAVPDPLLFQFKLDTIPPSIDTLILISSSTLQIHFSEKIKPEEDISEQIVLSSGNQIHEIAWYDDGTILEVVFEEIFANGKLETLHINVIQDFAGNILAGVDVMFRYFVAVPAERNDIVINELMVDPTPIVQQPEAEYIEFYNSSSKTFNLKGWSLSDATSTKLLPDIFILPNEFLLITSNTAAQLFPDTITVIGVPTMFTLTNAGEPIVLKDADGNVVDSVYYSSSWYGSKEKEDGGWSLERIDPGNNCLEKDNWKASVDESGGTPGWINSVYAQINDETTPTFDAVVVNEANAITLIFSEKLKTGIEKENILFFPLVEADTLFFINTDFNQIKILFDQPLDSSTVYTVSVQSVYDCPGNEILIDNSIQSFRLDNVKPQLDSIKVLSPFNLRLFFSEPMLVDSAVFVNQYLIDGHAVSIAIIDQNVIDLFLSNPLVNGDTYTLLINHLVDLVGNDLENKSIAFTYFIPSEVSPRDIIITEIFPDPSPSQQLPEYEFLELYNRSANPVLLKDWTISDGTSTTKLKNEIIKPGDYLILCSPSAKDVFKQSGAVMDVTGFPSLNNTGEPLVLKSPSGIIIDSLRYDISWYNDHEKRDGGWTLERIDLENQCVGMFNWTSSVDITGGTPGRVNSLTQNLDNHKSPVVADVIMDDDSLEIFFDENILPLGDLLSFEINDPFSVGGYNFHKDNAFALKIIDPLDSIFAFTLTVDGVKDCYGNTINPPAVINVALDTIKPKVLTIDVITSSALVIVFSEQISFSSSHNVLHYTVGNHHPVTAKRSADKKSVQLEFSQQFTNGYPDTLRLENITDLAGNIIISATFPFFFFEEKAVNVGDIVISEIFADPLPVVSLPETEYVELYNNSDDPVQLNGWSLSDASMSAVLGKHILLPQTYVLIVPSGQVNKFSTDLNVLGVNNFPSLANTGEKLWIKNADGITIDSVMYSDQWHSNVTKRDGGWSLELINPLERCKLGDNWASSIDLSGGTPGRKNSMHSDVPDVHPPFLQQFNFVEADKLILTFNKRLSNETLKIHNIQLAPDADIAEIIFLNDDQRELIISLTSPLDLTTLYTLTISNLSDCVGNIMADTSLTIKVDNQAPTVLQATIISETQIHVEFSEAVVLANVTTHFVLGGKPIISFTSDNKTFILTSTSTFINGETYQLFITGVQDKSGNVMTSTTLDLLFFQEQQASPEDVIISEIFADPTPTQGLPEEEYIEIYNRSDKPFDLEQWTIADNTSMVTLPTRILKPKQYLTLVSSTALMNADHILKVPGFPSLNNQGETLTLRDRYGLTIDEVTYDVSWYKDIEKSDGGFSLEIIDPDNLCEEIGNWTASIAIQGGTPGEINSVFAQNLDLSKPKLLRAIPQSMSTLVLQFDEKMQDQNPPTNVFTITPTIIVKSVLYEDKSRKNIQLELEGELSSKVLYEIKVAGISDCVGNEIDPAFMKGIFALPEEASPGDVVINEILFNPTPTGVDFVELLNVSNKYVNLKNWKLANIGPEGLVNERTISMNDFLLIPGSYVALCDNPTILSSEYLNARNVVKSSLPSLPDSKGSVVLLSALNVKLDSLFYTADMHSPLLQDKEGVSLERISITETGNNNWTSASAFSGYATPGYINSNARETFVSSDPITVSPEAFAPGTGSEFTLISYQFEKTGYVGSVKIMDAQGRIVKELSNNELFGTSGFLRWDGDDEHGRRARVGPYMVLIEVFNTDGEVKIFRKRVVVAGQFK